MRLRRGIEHRLHDVAGDRRSGLAAVLIRALDDDRDRDLGILRPGAKAMNQASSWPFRPVCAVPVLPAICTPGIWAARPVPSSTTCFIIPVTAAAVCSLNARLSGSLWRS